jgi:hypothetical protein
MFAAWSQERMRTLEAQLAAPNAPGFRAAPDGRPGRGQLQLELRSLKLLGRQHQLRIQVEQVRRATLCPQNGRVAPTARAAAARADVPAF